MVTSSKHKPSDPACFITMISDHVYFSVFQHQTETTVLREHHANRTKKSSQFLQPLFSNLTLAICFLSIWIFITCLFLTSQTAWCALTLDWAPREADGSFAVEVWLQSMQCSKNPRPQWVFSLWWFGGRCKYWSDFTVKNTRETKTPDNVSNCGLF